MPSRVCGRHDLVHAWDLSGTLTKGITTTAHAACHELHDRGLAVLRAPGQRPPQRGQLELVDSQIEEALAMAREEAAHLGIVQDGGSICRARTSRRKSRSGCHAVMGRAHNTRRD
jgi:hypothetical protein